MAKFKPIACGFHHHIMYGSLDSVCDEKQTVKRAIELNRKAVCVTDHGYMNSLPALWFEAKSNGIQCIHGVEAYVQIPNELIGIITKQYFHQTIHFRTYEATKFFYELTVKSEENARVAFGERKPIIELSDLEKIKEHIVLGSGCFDGIVQKLAREKQFELAEKYYLYLRDLVGKDNFFPEIMPHSLTKNWVKGGNNIDGIFIDGHFEDIGEDIQLEPSKFILKMAKKHGDRFLISEDSHMATKHQKLAQDVLLGNSSAGGWRFSTAYSMEDTNHWSKHLLTFMTEEDIHQAVDNSYFFCSRFSEYSFSTKDDRIFLPSLEMIYGKDDPEKNPVKKLMSIIKENGLMPSKDDPNYDIYVNRLKEEIDVMVNNGVANFIPYLLLVHDVVREFRDKGGFISPRGSAAGSLLLYLLGISIADPIKYGLLFARFLTKGRIQGGDFPDIDSDCADQKGVINYLEKKYEGSFCRVITDLPLKIKSAIRDIERSVRGSVSKETNFLATSIQEKGVGLDELLYGKEDPETGEFSKGLMTGEDAVSKLFQKWSSENPDLFEALSECVNVVKTHGVHACACLITDCPITEAVPVQIVEDKNKKRTLTSQYTGTISEKVGAIKYDFLGLATLNSMGKCIKTIEEKHGVKLGWCEFKHDEKVYEEIIAKDNLSGIFQMSAGALRPYVKKMPPKNIMEISNIIALIRPGALEAPSPRPGAPVTESAADFYVECVNGRQQPYFIHQDLKPITGHTYSVILYQEQIMNIFKDLADYSESDAAAAMKAVSKKKKKLLAEHCSILRDKVLKRGWNEQQADLLIDSVIASGRYSFNLSHSLSYAINAYNESYLKYHYEIEFWSSKLNTALENQADDKKMKPLVSECINLISPIHAKYSHSQKWVIDYKNNKIITPMAVVKGVGITSAQNIRKFLNEHHIENFTNLCKKAKEVKLKYREYNKEHKEYLKDHPEEKKKFELDASSVVTLLYHGAFDEYIEEEIDSVNIVDIYKKCADKFKKAITSQAANKNIANINNNIELQLFRQINNVTYRFNIAEMLEHKLLKMGYQKTKNKIIPYVKDDNHISCNLQPIYNSNKAMGIYKFQKKLQICGVVDTIELRTTKKNGKPYYDVVINIGNQLSPKLKIWCSKSGDFNNELINVLQSGYPIIVDFTPDIWNSFLGGKLENAYLL